MSSVEIWLTICLVLSVSSNAFLYWYIRRLLSRYITISSNITDLTGIVKNYSEHLERVYNMELFYGDETLRHLMSHTNSLNEILEDYKDVYSIVTDIPDTEEEPKDDTTSTPQVSEENIFYAGTRRSDN